VGVEQFSEALNFFIGWTIACAIHFLLSQTQNLDSLKDCSLVFLMAPLAQFVFQQFLVCGIFISSE